MSGHERERLSAYLDRELPPGEQAAVEAHLAACPECAAFLAELAEADEAAASLPAEAPDSYFEAFPARVRARLEARKPVRPRLPAWTWAAAAALLLAVVTPLTVRQLRAPMAAVESDAAVTPPPAPAESGPAPMDEPRRSELSATARPAPQQAPMKQGPPPAVATAAVPEARAPVAAGPAPEADPAAARSELAAESAFTREPAAPPVVGGVAREAEASHEKAAPDRLRPAAARANAEPGPAVLSAATAGAAAEAAAAPEREDALGRLEAARPRSAAEWRRLRDQWNAFAAVESDPLRADEARVRAVEAAREAWRAGGDEADAAAFRREADAYLRRADARQKARVESLLAEP